MPPLSEHDHEQQPGRGKRSLIVPAIVVAVVLMFVVLHLTGVVGAGSH
jgi:flagellar basal body-associated protein FliL